MRIGVLALQGDFAKHAEMLMQLDCEVVEVRHPRQLEKCEALIIPGGESTTLLHHIEFIGLRLPLLEFSQHKNIFGTCAGLILMSTTIKDSSLMPLGILDVSIKRNAFGGQLDSFQSPLILNDKKAIDFNAFFIRAPQIVEIGSKVEILSKFDGKAVLVRQGKHLGACFHPELTHNSFIHQYFLNMVQANSQKTH